MSWQPIETAPEHTPILIGRKGWVSCIAERDGKSFGECLGGDFYGTRPPFEPTHWMPLGEPPDDWGITR